MYVEYNFWDDRTHNCRDDNPCFDCENWSFEMDYCACAHKDKCDNIHCCMEEKADVHT